MQTALTENDRWILGGRWLDFLLILFPGFFFIALGPYFPEESAPFVFYAFIVGVLIDSGHVYLTAFRTVLRPVELRSHPTYWVTPLLTCAAVCLWLGLQIPYFWVALVYFGIFHYNAQFYGMLRWYEKINGRFCPASHRFLHALMLLPFIGAHFRQPIKVGYYTDFPIFFIPHDTLYWAGVAAFAATVAAWLVFEWRLFRRGRREFNRFCAILGPAVIYGWCFLAADTGAEVLFPVLVAHGIPYFAIMDISLRRLNPSFFHGALKVTGLLVATALIFSVGEKFYEEHWVGNAMSDTYVQAPLSWFQIVLTGIFMTPLLCHYIWDGHLWRGKHREAKIIYAHRRESLPGR